jgi:NADPH-dependent ferric siderophore reductase
MTSPMPASSASSPQAASAPTPRRRSAPPRLLRVERTEVLGPRMVRVHLGGPGFDEFLADASPEKLAMTDRYVKLQFAKLGLGLERPYDVAALRETLPPEDMPVTRTYTIRSIDREARTLALDFVVHGDEGLAGPWAEAARPGDLLSFTGPGGGFAPTDDPAVPRLLLGDDAALPAIAAALEEMPREATGFALIEVDGAADQQDLVAPDGIDVRWLHRSASDAGPGEALLAALADLEPLGAATEVFAHGERETMKQVRRILQDGWGLDRRAMSLSAYWANGRAEDQFQAEKKAPENII